MDKKKETSRGRAALRASTSMEPSGGAKNRDAPATVSAPTGALVEHEALYHAAEGFIRENSNFESSTAINTAIEELAQTTTLMDLFQLPLQHKLFNLDAALRWALFLSVAPARAVEEGDAPFSKNAFNADVALALVAGVYDIGIQEVAWVHFEAEDDDEEGEDDEEEVEDK
jgi:hypothetical protein